MVYIFLADGFEEVEAITPYDYLKRSGEDVFSVGVDDRKVAGSHGLVVLADTTIDELDIAIEKSDILILPGGLGGVKNLSSNKKVLEYVNKFFKFASVAAICAAPFILGDLGILEGFEACCYPGFEKYLRGAKVLDEPVVVCKNIITSRGAGTAQEFSFEIIKYICGENKAKDIKNEVQWKV